MKRILTFCLVVYIAGALMSNFQNRLLLFMFPEKIWIHRVNSVDKLKEVVDKFKGVELDVVFKEGENKFDVNHPPAQSIDLSLFEYLSSIKLSANNRFWLDFKNLSESNMNSSCLKLDSLCNKLMINKEKIIVESTNLEYLSPFKTKGFRTSHYLFGTLDRQLTSKIKNIRLLNKTDFISSDKHNYTTIKDHFPDEKILTWSYGFSDGKSLRPDHLLRNLKSLYMKFKVLSDDNVSVVLFSYYSKNGDR